MKKIQLLQLVQTWSLCLERALFIKGKLQPENKLISYERAFKMLKNDTYITIIGQAVLELLSFKFGSGNH